MADHHGRVTPKLEQSASAGPDAAISGEAMKLCARMSALVLCLVAPLFSCDAGNRQENTAPGVDTVLIVLGNEPLDDSTPTVDMIARVEKAVAYQKDHPASLLVFTGGPTVGTNSEARMMAAIAVSKGIPTNAILLEEKARSTGENARLTAGLIRSIAPSRIFVVSKTAHLAWAMRLFRELPVFRHAEPLACNIDRKASIRQMEKYLAKHDNPRVRQRLQRLYDGIEGVD